MNEDLTKKYQNRLSYLSKLYDLSKGSVSTPINGAEIGAQIGLKNGDENILFDIAKFLESENLIKVLAWLHGIPASVQLTHEGLKKVEELLFNTNKDKSMSNPIEENAIKLLCFLVENAQVRSVNGQTITQYLKINPTDVNDSVNFLKNLGAIECFNALGTAPYNFQAVSVTTNGKVLYYNIQKDSNQENKTMNSSDIKIQIFISHSNSDEKLVSLLIDLIRATIKIDSKEIRCTSVPGYKLPPGHTSSMLKKELEECQIVLGFITENSIKSNYVNFELGAGWYLDKAWAVLDSDINYNQIPGPLSEHNALKLDDHNSLSSLIENIHKKIGKEMESLSIVNSKINNFLENYRDLKKKP